MANQPFVRVIELELEKQRWNSLSLLLKNLCNQSGIGFSHGNYHQELKSKYDKILVTFLFDRIDYNHFMSAADMYRAAGKKMYVLTDSWIDETKFQHPNAVCFSVPKLFSLTTLNDQIPKELTKPSKLYNAFIHRTDPVRQSWFYFLFLRNLLDKGYVSYKLYQINTHLLGEELFTQIHNNYLSTVDSFNYAFNNLKELVPYTNFLDSDRLSDLILDTKYSLVLDTYAPDDDAGSYYISEKITRALQYPNISLPFVQKNTLQKLSNDGLYINPTMLEIDHDDWIIRQQKILSILETDSITVSSTDLYDQANHNRTVLSSWLTSCTTKNFYTEIFDTINAD